MNRKIRWISHEFDEIECVYEKADESTDIGKMMEQLEETALSEVERNCGTHIMPDEIRSLGDVNEETVIKVLAGYGFGSMNIDISTAAITIEMTVKIQHVLACTGMYYF